MLSPPTNNMTVERNVDLAPVILQKMPIRHRFEKIHGDRTAVRYLNFFAGIREDKNFCLNILVAQYYGVRHVVAAHE